MKVLELDRRHFCKAGTTMPSPTIVECGSIAMGSTIPKPSTELMSAVTRRDLATSSHALMLRGTDANIRPNGARNGKLSSALIIDD